MHRIITLAIFLTLLGQAVPTTAQDAFTYRTVYSGLEIPWEIEFGPDSTLWTTERIGLMSRIDLNTGEKKVILDMRDELYYTMETGMLGFCWHPDFPDSSYVYLATVGGTSKETSFRLVLRFTYANDTLQDPVEIFRLDPADSTHQGCRLRVGQDRKLYVTMGDSPGEEGADKDQTLVGKVLRMNLDGSVPEDNPIPGELMYTKGHRNVQGFVQLPDGTVFTSEHGNIIEDEVNRLVPGGNYGWPIVEGACDDPWELDYCDSANVVEPVWSSGVEETVAPCGLEYYNHELYPSLQNSLLLMTLKNSAIYQLTLNDDHTEITGTTIHLQRSVGRLRDIAITAGGRIFLCTSNREPNAYFPFPLAEDDRIIELIPLPADAVPQLTVPDTVHVNAPVNSEHRFPIPVTNAGKGNLRIDGLWTMDQTVPVRGDQWRVPVIVAPETSYNIAGVFFPSEEGQWIGQLRVVTETQGQHDVFVVGSTDIGELTTPQDTVTVQAPVGLGKVFTVHFDNSGALPVHINAAEILGPDADHFEIVSAPSGVLDPGESISASIRFTPETDGVYEGILAFNSDAYRSDSVHLFGVTPTSSVHDNALVQSIKAYPNPFVSTIHVVIPEPYVTGVLSIMDLHGMEILRTAIDGRSLVSWDGRDESGALVGTGVYVVRVTGTEGTSTLVIQHLE